jgi:hypothetical protein
MTKQDPCAKFSRYTEILLVSKEADYQVAWRGQSAVYKDMSLQVPILPYIEGIHWLLVAKNS